MKRLVLLSIAVLSGCALMASPDLRPGLTEVEVLREMGQPTGRYSVVGSGTRLEFATGPYGRTTWMVDLDASGRVSEARQVLGEASFAAFQEQAAGLRPEDVLRALGRPGERRQLGWQGGELWSWRYPTNDCLWFQVSIGLDGLVTGGSYGIDPICDAPSDRD